MGTSNFNVRRNSSVMPVFTNEDILGDDFRTEFIDLDEWNESRFGYCYEDVRDDEYLVAECIFEMI